MPNAYHKKYNEFVDEIEWNNAHRSTLKEKLTPEENFEISLFHSFKQDPYYKHHLRTHLAKQAEDTNQNFLSVQTEYHDLDPDDHMKFDRLNLFDFRRQLPFKEREA